ELLKRLAAEVTPGNLADEEDERRRVLVGGVDADGGVRRTGRACDEADPRAPRELAVGVGHVRGAGLVTRRVESDRRVRDRVEDAEIALARDAKGGVDTVDDQLVDEDARGGAAH